MNRHSAVPPAQNHSALALVRAYRVMRAVSVFWASPGRYTMVFTATGHILYHQVEEMIRIPIPTEGELAKAAAEESSRGEFGC